MTQAKNVIIKDFKGKLVQIRSSNKHLNRVESINLIENRTITFEVTLYSSEKYLQVLRVIRGIFFFINKNSIKYGRRKAFFIVVLD